MAELGSGDGTDYPSALDTDATIETDGLTVARAAVPNDIAAAVVAIESELGVNPAGTKADVKTYLQTEHNTNGTHGAITATSLQTDGSNAYKFTSVNIGDWDMNATASVNVAHGLGASFKNIKSVSVIIRNDADDTYYDLVQTPAGASTVAGGITSIDTTNVALTRDTGGTFDNPTFDSTTYNRGWVTIIYV